MLNMTRDELFDKADAHAFFDAIPGLKKWLVFWESDHDVWKIGDLVLRIPARRPDPSPARRTHPRAPAERRSSRQARRAPGLRVGRLGPPDLELRPLLLSDDAATLIRSVVAAYPASPLTHGSSSGSGCTTSARRCETARRGTTADNQRPPTLASETATPDGLYWTWLHRGVAQQNLTRTGALQ